MNVSALIDRRFSTFQIEVLILCFFMSLIDGFDSQIMSVAVPAVVEDMNLPPSALGALLSASQWGALVGALTLGNYADRVGRRLVLIFCGLLLSATMIGTAMAGSHLELVVLRILTGLGVGGAMPCFIALSIEYSPRRYRSTVASIVCSGVPVGGIVVGMMGAAMMPELGWRSVFWAGGALSLAVTLLTAWRIPESVAFAIAQRYPAAAIRRILERLAPGEIDAGETRFFTDDSAAGQVKASVRELFRGNLAWVTMLCWIAFFLSYIVLIGTLVWTPGLMRQSGMDMSSASLVLSLNNVGGACRIHRWRISRRSVSRAVLADADADLRRWNLQRLFHGSLGAGVLAGRGICNPGRVLHCGRRRRSLCIHGAALSRFSSFDRSGLGFWRGAHRRIDGSAHPGLAVCGRMGRDRDAVGACRARSGQYRHHQDDGRRQHNSAKRRIGAHDRRNASRSLSRNPGSSRAQAFLRPKKISVALSNLT